jgi:hypothetical protein
MKVLLGAGLLVTTAAACTGAPPTTAPEYEAVELAPEGAPTAATPESTATAAAADAAPTAAPPAASAQPVASAPPAASAAPSASAPPPALAVTDANLSVGSITADGFTMKDLACKLDGGGGLGAVLLGPTIAASLSKKKAALDACAPKGAEARVRFTAAGGKIASAEASAGDPKIEACVVKVLKTVPGVADGTCSASLHVGK